MVCLTNHLHRESTNLFYLHLVDQKAVTAITLDAHVIRRSARIRILLRLMRKCFIFMNTVLSLITVWYLYGEIESSIYRDEALHNVNVTCHHAMTYNSRPLTTIM